MSAGGTGYRLAIVASVVVAGTLAAAIMVMGPPSAQRQQKLDSRRVEDLARIDQFIRSSVDQGKPLPADLATLAREPGLRLSITDPLDGSAYTYTVTGDRTFRLCAVFATDSGTPPGDLRPWPGDEWSHGTGRRCFERSAKKAK